MEKDNEKRPTCKVEQIISGMEWLSLSMTHSTKFCPELPMNINKLKYNKFINTMMCFIPSNSKWIIIIMN